MIKSSRRAFWVLAALVLAAHGLGVWALGFYNDDYSWLGTFAQTGSRAFPVLAATLKAAQPGDVAARVGAIVFAPGLYSLFGSFAPFYQFFYLLLDLAVAWGLYRLLVEEGVDESSALAAAGLAVLYPNHDATHHWLVCSPAPAALAGVLAAVRLSRRGIRAPAAVLFTASCLLYESSALLAMLPFALEFAKSRDLRRSLVRSWELPAALAGVVLYQRVLVPHLLGHERHPMSLSLVHAFDVAKAGLECTLLNRLTHGIARGVAWAATGFGAGDWMRLVLAGALVGFAGRELPPRPERPSRTLLVLAGAFIVLGYAPFALDPKYTPEIFTANNRLNLVPSLGGACALAWLVARLRAPAGKALLTAAAFAFLVADRASLAQWARAYALQHELLAALQPRLATLCSEGGDLLFFGAEERVGSAVVFESTYDLDGALALRGCAKPSAVVATGRVRFEDGAAVYSWMGERPFPYARLWAYDARRGVLARLADRRAGEAFAAASAAGL